MTHPVNCQIRKDPQIRRRNFACWAFAIAALSLLLNAPRLHAQQLGTRSGDKVLSSPPPPARFLMPVALNDTGPNTTGSPQAGEDEFGLAPPSRERLFRIESEQAFRDRLRQELPKVKNVQFPRDVPFVPLATTSMPFPLQETSAVPGIVCYRPLYFEDKSAERYGQYVPCIQPLISMTKFYLAFLELPIHTIATPPWTFECDIP